MESPPQVPATLTDQDASQLSLLAVFHYVLAAFTFLFGCLPIIYLVIGIAMLTHPEFFSHRDGSMGGRYQTHEEMQEEVLFGDAAIAPPAETLPTDAAAIEPVNEYKVLGGFMVGGAIIAIVLVWAMAALFVAGGRSLQKRNRYRLCMVAAGVSCLCVPFGTVLGVFTFMVLQRPAVAEFFKRTCR